VKLPLTDLQPTYCPRLPHKRDSTAALLSRLTKPSNILSMSLAVNPPFATPRNISDSGTKTLAPQGLTNCTSRLTHLTSSGLKLCVNAQAARLHCNYAPGALPPLTWTAMMWLHFKLSLSGVLTRILCPFCDELGLVLADIVRRYIAQCFTNFADQYYLVLDCGRQWLLPSILDNGAQYTYHCRNVIACFLCAWCPCTLASAAEEATPSTEHPSGRVPNTKQTSHTGEGALTQPDIRACPTA
jgi:hypothetical protein